MSERDYATLLDVVHNITAGSETRAEFSTTTVSEVRRLVRSDVVTFNEVDPVLTRVAYISAPESYIFPPGSDLLFASLAHQHPLIRHHAETGDGSAIKVSDFVSVDDWHTLEIYRKFFAEVGVEHQMSITLPAPAPIVVGIAVNRSDRDFDERDRTVLNLLRPHLAQEWRRARDRSRIAALTDAASAAFAESGIGAVLVDSGAHELTDGALISLYRFFGRPGLRDPLPARVRAWLDGEIAANKSRWMALDTGDLDARALELRRPLRAAIGDQALVLRYVPRHSEPGAVILLTEISVDRPSELLKDVGLTTRETDIVRQLGTGATNAQLAERLGLSPWTVKRHLSNIYAKLGVTSRAGAVAIALEFEAHYRP